MLFLLLALFAVASQGFFATLDKNLLKQESFEAHSAMDLISAINSKYIEKAKQKSNAVLPLLSPYNLNVSVVGYSINGTMCLNVSGLQCENSTLVIDPPNNRMLFDLGNIGGKFVMFPNSSFVYGLPQAPGICFNVAGWNYTTQVKAYSEARSTFGATDSLARFTGIVFDVGSCGHDLGLTVIQSLKFTIELDFAQRFPVAPTVCLNINGIIKYDLSTLNTWSNKNPFFALPPGCSAPLDYCDSVYPPNNPCHIPR